MEQVNFLNRTKNTLGVFMNKTELVSIITPAYNCEDVIRKTYLSILKQSYKNWEWIVTDDCSTDSTFSVISEIAKKDNRVKAFQNNKNSGAAIARNKSIENANGRFLAFLDSDDEWVETKLEKQINFMLQKNYSFTYSNYYVKKQKNRIIKYRPHSSKITYKKMLIGSQIGCLTVVLDKKYLKNFTMPTDAPRREDYAAWLDVLKNNHFAYRIDEYLAIYTVSKGSVSRNKLKMFKYQWIMYRKHEKFNLLKTMFLISINCVFKLFKKY